MTGDGPDAARLLVVEDEQMILELLSGALRFAGFDVVTAVSGAEALRAVAASRPDLMLLDVMIPDGDGFEVMRRMRSSGPHVPVIFLTARDGVRERVAGLALGGDDYVTKPFSLDEVVERIRAVLRRAGRPATTTRLRVSSWSSRSAPTGRSCSSRHRRTPRPARGAGGPGRAHRRPGPPDHAAGQRSGHRLRRYRTAASGHRQPDRQC